MNMKKNYKLYKSGKLWVTAAIATLALTTGMAVATTNAAAATGDQPQSQPQAQGTNNNSSAGTPSSSANSSSSSKADSGASSDPAQPAKPADTGKKVINTVTVTRTIIITGPNTGGKTITLKTLGLLQLMGQSGLFIPAYDGSTISVFDNVFADIGDEQNLSTFSGHMENVKHILEKVTSHSLVLLDELGAGTDPKEGAALAMAILNELNRRQAEVVITTHYPELKVYGFEHHHTINASMEFDAQTLRPTYKLLLGIPGQSNGIAIAKRLGIKEQVIDDAKSLIKDDSQELNAMIGDLVEQRKQARERNEHLQKLLADNESKQADLDRQLNRFNENRDHLFDQARSKANHEVSVAKRKANQIIHHLRQMEVAQGKQIKENELIDAQGQLNALHQDSPLRHNSVSAS